MRFTLLTGHYAVKKGDALQLSNSDAMPLLPSAACKASILSPTNGEAPPHAHMDTFSKEPRRQTDTWIQTARNHVDRQTHGYSQ